MTDKEKINRHIIDFDNLPEQYPTQMHSAEFWEHLGRTIATFGFLEEVLSKAIFAITATREYAPEDIEAAFKKWVPTLERALSDPLGNLIDVYARSVRENQSSTIKNLDDLIEDLRSASELRNVLCHGSWGGPDENGASIPYFFNRKGEKFDTLIDLEFLKNTQRHTAKLACNVINTVTHMGFQFPGSNGPGKKIM